MEIGKTYRHKELVTELNNKIGIPIGTCKTDISNAFKQKIITKIEDKLYKLVEDEQ